jgi:hypothetical protein
MEAQQPAAAGLRSSHVLRLLPADTAAQPAAAAAAVSRRYIAWKHSSLLQLDYGAVMFCAFYLLTLLLSLLLLLLPYPAGTLHGSTAACCS